MANPVQPQLQDPGSTSPLDLPEMEKLLTKVENKDDQALNLSKSLSGALDLEQNGHSLPFKVISEGHRQPSLSGSPSRASSRRASSVITTSYAQDQEAPKDYLVLAIASCFCPVWPLNLIPLIFSIMPTECSDDEHMLLWFKTRVGRGRAQWSQLRQSLEPRLRPPAYSGGPS
ncbi:trafficking regulator of GLUT4 1 [Grammomys surdaster]|uniref:trafficking regulator of GLUT4 1 n=1 Tax=Grammomys surdaster TaxID=491861 RepID=UPI00109F7EC1|nr:trafficking regulator of GLUT4 1 [Grammomys surdaster]